jgi:CBS domain-containing protein
VVDGSRVVGVLTRADLFGALAAKDKSRVADAMRPQTEVVDAAASLEQSLATLDPRAKPLIPVTEAGRLVGILTAENIGEFVMIRSALRSRA